MLSECVRNLFMSFDPNNFKERTFVRSLFPYASKREMTRRGVPVIRYADDIVVLAKSKRAAERLLETTQRYLEGKLKLKMNVDKSRVVSVFSIRNFKFLGFA